MGVAAKAPAGWATAEEAATAPATAAAEAAQPAAE